jgi:hypothetical protein
LNSGGVTKSNLNLQARRFLHQKARIYKAGIRCYV